MAILKVARMGHPVLREVAKDVSVKEIRSPEFQSFIDDMVDTMHEYEGVGLAAPQVHRSVRVSVIEYGEDNPRYNTQGHSGLQIYINPKLEVLTEETMTNWEGCLSVPGLRGLVKRPNKVRVKYLDRDAKACEITAEGFLAIVMQHEFDHLDGVLYVDKTEPMQLVFEKEFEKYILPKSDEEILD